MRYTVCHKVRPQHCAASRTSGVIASNARCIGCTANGMLNSTDATTSPLKLNASVCPVSDSNH